MSQAVRLEPRRRLTPSQELIWASQRLHPDVPLQNMANLSRFGQPIDPSRFVAAVDRVIRGSDVLRTVVREVDGVPHPSVLAEPPSPTEILALERTELDEWMAHRIAVPLDVSTSMYDSVLLDHRDGTWSWWLDVHHLACDAASSALFFNAVADAYFGEWVEAIAYTELVAQLVSGESSKRWQRAADHWADTIVPDVDTRLYRLDPGSWTEAERMRVPLPPSRKSRLDALLADRFRLLSADLSLTAALGTVLVAYLSRLQDGPIVFGMPVSNRVSRDSRTVLGPLVEFFPVHVDVEADDTFVSLQKRVASQIIDVLRHAQPGTSPRQSFDVVLNVHGATFGSFGPIPTETTWIHPGHIDEHHRLRVQALDYSGSGDLELDLDINHKVADADHRRRAVGHFGAVLDAMLDDPDRTIDSFGLVDASERAALAALTSPGPGKPLDGMAPDIVRERLAAHANRPALSCNDRVLTGAEVDDLIENAAQALRQAGFGRGDLIALEMPLGIDVVIALHAVLRAGAAFVPIDPAYPEARRAHIRSDCGARLTATSLQQLLDLDGSESIGTGDIDRDNVDPDDLAYVIYTSGSTGLPKGVPITHRGLSEYLGFAYGAYVDGAAPVMPLFTSLSFDLSITTLFLPFIAGGTMPVYPEGGLPALRAIADDRSATILKATPSHLELLGRMIDDRHPLRTLIVGGEAFMSDLADRLLDTCGSGLSIFNEYGPTEAVVGCMEHLYDPTRDAGPEVPIGRPAPGVGLHVLDRAGHPVPLGIPGELYISRPGMTSGYLGRPDLDRDKFVVRPDSGSTDVLYRTGDLVRMLDVDRMVYLGRIDQQIKVGGIRLEPGEIEATAQAVGGVRRAVAGLWFPDPDHRVELCVRCGLGSDVPGVTIDGDGVCSSCHDYDLVAPQADAWFRTEDDLRAELEDARDASTGEYDVLHLLSGGKDSTYALHRLVDMGARVYAITLDNGFIAEVAKENVRRAIRTLGVDHEFVTVDAMNEIFRDSLERYSNVCNGCYKAIYTVALQRAEQLGIPAIVTGLSRGQFFETRLVPGMFVADRFDTDMIDGAVVEARRVYHHAPDAVHEHMDTAFLEDGSIFDRISFIDFYRYVDVELSELYESLESTGIWKRPPDSGRSTNCLINAAGIFVHKIEQGHHNYALPYGWDVRLGHKTRQEALFELDDPMDAEELAAITSMLAEVGYEPRRPEILTLWVEADSALELEDVRSALRDGLPAHAQPRAIEVVESIPLTVNGKVDMSALPPPAARRVAATAGEGRLPESTTEQRIASIWSTVLGLPAVSATDDFFALGGTSLHALEMIVRVSDACAVAIPESLAFKKRTVAELAAAIDVLEFPDEQTRAPLELPDLVDQPRKLSSGEEAMLYEWRRDPADRRYNVARLYRIPDGYDRDRFDEAVRAVVAHQPTLHTSYALHRSTLPVERAVRISSVTSDTASLDSLADRLNEEPFDLVSGPLMTVHHLESGDTDDGRTPAILIRTHHIVSDAGSLDVLWNQIDRAYRGESLPELDASYAWHGEWQRSRRPDPAEVWSVDPENPPGEFSLRPLGFEDDGYVHLVSSIPTDALRGGPGTTSFATALTALTIAMAPYHSRNEFELTITSSVRDHPAMKHVVGYFLNPLPLLVSSEAEQSVAAVAAQVSERLAAALAHRSVPYASVVRSARERSIPAPTSRVMLAVEDLASASLDGSAVDHSILSSGTAVNDLTFFVQIRGQLVELGAEYRGASVSRRQAEDLLQRFADVLASIIEDQSRTVGSVGTRPTPMAGPPFLRPADLVPSSVFDQIEAAPGSPAAMCGGERIDYGELGLRARALAGRLRAVGVGVGDRVAVVVPRSVDLPVSIIACWMLGASYVPIDVAQPVSRIRDLVMMAGAEAAISTGEGHEGLGEVATVLADRPDSAVLPVTRMHLTQPEDEAYVIFTSGSTGQPKGVPISHANLAASVAARLQWYADPVRRYLLLSSAGFDSSVAGLFWTMVDGGELVMPAEHEVHDVDALLLLITSTEPSHMLCVPSLYGALLQRNGAALPGLQTVIVAGEVCPIDLVKTHHQFPGAGDLVNEYGPTEATVWATAHLCRADDPYPTVPIGGPIPGVTAHVVDREGVETPIDVSGELWISGPTVARAYLSDDEGDRFAEGLGAEPTYRTGDRVVRRAGGLLEFLGRVDEQLSVGGVRIEPTEVEQALTLVDGVQAAAVALSGVDLVAWVESARVASDEIREMVTEHLPATHIPRRIVIVDSLPRNRNGKIDRDRLADLSDGVIDIASDRALDVRGGPEVTRMIEIWGEAFDGRAVAATDDFFGLGGDSLRAVVLVSMLETEYGRRVGIGELIDAPTPLQLASRFRPAGADAVVGARRRSEGLVEWLRSSGDKQPLIVLPPGGGNLLRYAPLVGALDASIPVVGLRLPGADARSDTIDTIDGQAREMLAALDTTEFEGPYRFLGWSTGGLIAWEMAQMLLARGDSVQLVGLVDSVMGGMHVEAPRSPAEKYAEMLRSEGPVPVIREGAARIFERAQFSLARRRYRASRRRGETPSMADAERQLGPVIRRASISYRPDPLAAPVVYFSASESDNRLTVDPWTDLQRGRGTLDVVELEGVHFLPEDRCIIGPSRVAELVTELDARL